ncbi:MAG: DUF4942 domain-containing protein [Polycyclovorans sp.]|nr:DUF4942 domain-containing protein [Polycyclovorans sp.]
MSLSTTLRLPPTIAEMVDNRDRAVAYLREAGRCIDQAEEAATMIRRHAMPFGARFQQPLDRLIAELDRVAWREAFRIGGFEVVWDAQARKEFDDSLEKCPPEFTEANLRDNLLEYLPQKDHLFARGLVAIFRRLSGDYKRHSHAGFSVPQKIVVQRWSGLSFAGGRMIAYYYNDEVRDFMRVLHKLTEREFDYGPVQSLINAAWAQGEPFQDEYVVLKAHKNGNVHIHIKDRALLARINTVVADYYGGNALGEAA